MVKFNFFEAQPEQLSIRHYRLVSPSPTHLNPATSGTSIASSACGHRTCNQYPGTCAYARVRCLAFCDMWTLVDALKHAFVIDLFHDMYCSSALDELPSFLSEKHSGRIAVPSSPAAPCQHAQRRLLCDTRYLQMKYSLHFDDLGYAKTIHILP